MKKLFKRSLLFVLIVFVLPAGLSAIWWWSIDRPRSWHEARWDATGILPAANASIVPAVYVMAARTGGMKGAFSMHSWLVIKDRETGQYERYDKVGWGRPVRRNAYAPDARWYSNRPQIIVALKGTEAVRVIPKIRQSIAQYPYLHQGDYTIWPGPNSNSFVAHVLRDVPELNAVLPPLAIGRDYLSDGLPVFVAPDWQEFQFSLGGLIGLSVGTRSGLEVQLLGLVAGIDLLLPAVKLPGFGRIGFQR